MARITLEMPLNRVEGDLDVALTIEDGQVVVAKSIGTLYRGFENMLKGRDPLDALVITPRICGICSITHLTAAVKSLEDAQEITPPAQAVRLRNLSIMAETVQSDLRQVFLMYLPDFAHEYYAGRDFYDEAVRWYAPLKGEGSVEALRASKDILKVIAIIGGQWPHTSHMVPGGICTIPSVVDLTLAQTHIFNIKSWYAQAVVGVDEPEMFLAQVQSAQAFDEWVETHPDTHLARFVRLNRAVELDRLGASYDGFLSFGAIDDPENPKVPLRPAGVFRAGRVESLAIEKICEDVSHSWYEEAVGTCQPPERGETRPKAGKMGAYSWGKAPRYEGQPLQTGPLAQALVAGDPLITDLYRREGDSAFLRELARLLRPAVFLPHMCDQIRDSLNNFSDPTYEAPPKLLAGEGVGLVEAARGALGHWLKVDAGKISHYQVVTPTAWNGSPMDHQGQPGPWEKALLGVPVDDIEHPITVGHVIRSFDPCLVCTVHAMGDVDEVRWRLEA